MGNLAVKAMNHYLEIYELLLALNVKALVPIKKLHPARPWERKLCCQVKELWEEGGSLPSIKKDAKEIDQIFTDNLKRQDPEPLSAMKEQTIYDQLWVKWRLPRQGTLEAYYFWQWEEGFFSTCRSAMAE